MRRMKSYLALAFCGLLFVLAIIGALLFTADDTAVTGTSGHIVLNEILSSNRTYPAPNGEYLDYIEIYNASGTPTDISGYMISDDGTSIGYTFPKGSVLEPYGYALCWCWKDGDNDEYAAFGISQNGGETIYLYNDANVQVDAVETPRLEVNHSFARMADGTWAAAKIATPGFENSDKGYEEWLAYMGADHIPVVISEVMTGNYCTAINSQFQTCDWIELMNQGSEPVILDRAWLSDDPAVPLKWQIPAMTLGAGEYALIPCVGTGATDEEADFAMPTAGCTVILTSPLGNAIHSVDVPAMTRGLSWALSEQGDYGISGQATPGYANDPMGYSQWLAAVGAEGMNVAISEVMTRNRSTILGTAGTFCDWIELVNNGSQPVDLTGAYLTNDPTELTKWQIPELQLAPGERAVIPCAGENAGTGEADFGLSADGCTLILTGAAGNFLWSVECPALKGDRVYALQPDGSYFQTDLATPGRDNTEADAREFRATQGPLGALAISEVMPSNDLYYRQSDGNYYDWVELINVSDAPIELSDYALSNDPEVPNRFVLPERTLKPGERIIVICSGTAELTGSSIRAPFSLSREESWLYVSTEEGFSDYIRIYDVPYRGSVGRVLGENGTKYFAKPTPGAENGTGVAAISPTPMAMTEQGIYNDIQSLAVALSGEGEIHYTLDGSFPSQSDPVYTEPLTLKATTVVRFASFVEGMLPSDVVTASYIINENHTMPVLSIAAEPGEFSGPNGIYENYTRDQEIRCSFSMFEEAGSFSIDCGLKMYGHTALELPKKNLKVNFRGKYGTDVLSYPVYGEEGPEIFDSLCIRAGQDNPFAIMREELFASLCDDMSDDVLVQRSRYCIVYVNGEYYGIYSLKEAFGETYYSQNKGVSEESVEIIQAPAIYTESVFKLLYFCQRNDMTIPENYEYICQNIDINSLIDWMIIQGYSTNGDVQQNLRYFRSTENGNKWQFALYDLDWAFYFHWPFSNMLSETEWQHKMLTRNIAKNPEFQEQFLSRVSELLATTLSDENVLKRIDELEAILLPEIQRDRKHWGYSYSQWQKEVNTLRNFITEGNHLEGIISNLRRYLGLSSADMEKYFGRWIS